MSERKKVSIRVILKSGAEFTVKCECVYLSRNENGKLKGFNFVGCSENKPAYLDVDDVSAMIRILSDENWGEENEK